MEAVDDKISGFLVEPRDVDSLVEAMENMLKMSREERKEMGIQGRKKMEEAFSKEKVVEETIETLPL